MKPLILTYTRKHINPLDIQQEDIDILDIAHALSNCNRFAGQSTRPISVAQHSVYVSRVVEAMLNSSSKASDTPSAPEIVRLLRDFDRQYLLQALLHDASEAYLGDMTKWVKASSELAGFRAIEQTLQERIYAVFGCPVKTSCIVETADRLMLRFEGVKAFSEKTWAQWRKNLPPEYCKLTSQEKEWVDKWSFWTWRQSREAFLTRARELGVQC